MFRRKRKEPDNMTMSEEEARELKDEAEREVNRKIMKEYYKEKHLQKIELKAMWINFWEGVLGFVLLIVLIWIVVAWLL